MMVAPITASRIPGKRVQRLNARITARTPRPRAAAVQLALPPATDWPIAPTDFYLDELVGEAVDALGGLAADGGVQTWVEAPAELRVRGDESLLRQMIVNLVENAIRHTPPGGTVRVKVTATAPDETDELVALGYLTQGIDLGMIGLTFDRGFVVDEDTPLGTLPAQRR